MPSSINRSKIQVSRPPQKPVLVFDGDCGFCRKWIARWRYLTGDRIDYEPYQKIADNFPEVTPERFQKAVQFIDAEGQVCEGAEAVFRSLSFSSWLKWLLALYRHLPGFAFVSERAYAFVADHRTLFSSADSCGLASSDEKPSYVWARWAFLKILALCYFFAFAGLGLQALGLYGQDGILPVHSFLRDVRMQWGPQGWWGFPSIFWFDDSDRMLQGVCGLGAILSAALFLGWAVVPCLVLLWSLYLSLVSVGQDFLSFQWDYLLLEAGFLAIFLAPWTWRFDRRTAAPPSPLILFLFQWLLFRLMFSAGVVKLSSGDANWRNLTAIHYHYETQPLPTPLAWFAHQMPMGFQVFSCLCMFFTELIVPLFIFGPRRIRPYAFGSLVFLQILIALTGNYGFFNLLAVGLCFFALEDAAWPKWMKRWGEPQSIPRRAGVPWPSWLLAVFSAFVLYMTGVQMAYTLGAKFTLPAPLEALCEDLAPLRSMNSYGLFAIMTTTRPEISVEGSRDGVHWEPYVFRWKAGDPTQAPRWVAPFQPRLDWQMWFAALSDYRQQPWFQSFLVKLLQGSPQVLGLLKDDPFPGVPPRFVRAEVYEYRFTDALEKSRTGDWWQRAYVGSYMPAFSLSQVQWGVPRP